MSGALLTQTFIYLVAAVVAVPLAKRLGLGSVLGYLLAGIALGPFVFGLVGGDLEVMHFAEFGVVMMLFLIGLELRPSLIWELRRPIIGLGGLQVVTTAGVVAVIGHLLGFSWGESITIGLVLSLSSTAIVLQSLTEKGLLQSEGGRASFSVLLFQDIAVIFMIAALPLLASEEASIHEAAVPSSNHGDAALAGMPGWLQGAVVLGAVGTVVLGGRYLIRPVFRYIARTRLREIFTATSLLLIIGIALLMELVGLSAALGTFLAGVVLADSEYRHEIVSDIEPFKGLLLGLFFISIGASIDFQLVWGHPGEVFGLAFGLVALKLVILYLLGRLFGLGRHARWLFSFALAQAGEFGFVLLSLAVQGSALDEETAAYLTASIAVSMITAPLLLLAVERVVLPRVAIAKGTPDDARIESEHPDVVVAGFGRFGQVFGRLLRAHGFKLSVLDLDPDMVAMLSRLGLEVHYGDASRIGLLRAAGCESAKLFVLAIDEPGKSLEIARLVRQSFPELPILARARNRPHVHQLRELGIDTIVRETLGSALDLGVAALRRLGLGAHRAHRAALLWRRHDERELERMADVFRRDEAEFFDYARKALQNSERLMREEAENMMMARDGAWDSGSLRKEVNSANAN